MIGLAPHTGKIIDAVAQLECIRGELFAQDANFHLLEPIYNVSAQEIESYIKNCLTK